MKLNKSRFMNFRIPSGLTLRFVIVLPIRRIVANLKKRLNGADSAVCPIKL
jgi:hypothetical protein